MCTFKITNNPNKTWIDDYLSLGGPTLSNSIEIGGRHISHHLLNVTGEITPQPVEKDGLYFILMGEIYNYDTSLPSDIYYGIEKYLEHRENFTKYLDGEFLFIVYNPYSQTIDFFTDPWSTRQAWYSEIGDNFYFTTLINDRSLIAFDTYRISPYNMIDRKKHYRIPHNSHCCYDIKNKKLSVRNNELHSWNLNQNIKSLDEVEKCFTDAVLKRWYPNCTLFLSGGVDSVAAVLCLTDNKKKFNAISLMSCSEKEDQDALSKTVLYCKDYINHYIINGKKKPNEIHEQVKKQFKGKVVLMGNGSDEFFDNYRSKDKSEFKYFPKKLIDIFPWKHFYGGQSRSLLDLHETYHLLAGLELRNIFYDKALVQSWLNVSIDIKNTEYKIFIKKYLRDRGIPISKFPKSGFRRQYK